MRFSFVSYGCLIAFCLCAESEVFSQTKDLTGNARQEIETPLTLSSRNKKAEPSDLYLEVYQLSSAGERFLKSGDLPAARKAYDRADGLLNVLQNNFPGWQPNVVLYRRNENARNIETIKKRLDEEEKTKKADMLGSPVIQNMDHPGGGGLMPVPGGAGLKTERENELESRLKQVLENLAQAQVRIRNLQTDLDKERQLKSPARSNRERDLEAQVKKLETELGRLRSEIVSARTQREMRLQKRLDETMVQLAAAHRRIEELEKASIGGVTGAAIERLNQALIRSESELKAVTKVLKDTQETLHNVMDRAVRAETDATAYKAQLAKARDQLKADQANSNKVLATLNKQYNELENKLKSAEEEKVQSEAEVKHLQERLKETEAQLVDVTKQKDAIEDERNQLADIIQLNNPGTTKALMDENMSMATHLKRAQEKIKELESTGTAQSSELESAQTELALAKKRLIELRDENMDYRKRVSQLNEKLRAMDAELERLNSQPKVDPRIVSENNLLRETIAKQIRVLESREKSRQLLESAYKRMKAKDPEMSAAIKMLENPDAIKLTDQDKSLLDKLPLATLSYGGSRATVNDQMAAYVERQMQVEALGKSALDAFNKGRMFASQQLYENLLEIHPGHYAGHVNLGVILLKQGKLERALKMFQTAVDLNPDHPVGQFLLGVTLFQLQRDASAQIALMASASLDPSNAMVYIYLGHIATEAGKTALAIQEYTKALELDPSLIDVHYNMASAYARAGKVDEARKCYDTLIRAGGLPDPDLERRLRIKRVAPAAQVQPASTPDAETEKVVSEQEKAESGEEKKEEKEI